jgi:hypothetical protein
LPLAHKFHRLNLDANALGLLDFIADCDESSLRVDLPDSASAQTCLWGDPWDVAPLSLFLNPFDRCVVQHRRMISSATVIVLLTITDLQQSLQFRF